MEKITVETISNLRPELVDKKTLKRLIDIIENEPDDLLRVVARVWMGDNAHKILKTLL